MKIKLLFALIVFSFASCQQDVESGLDIHNLKDTETIVKRSLDCGHFLVRQIMLISLLQLV